MTMTTTRRMKASDFDREVLDLFDGYIHGNISRRDFLAGASKYAVGGVTAAALLDMLAPNYALAQQVDPKDPKLKSEYVTYNSPNGTGSIKAYLSRPASATGKLPGIVVVHENRGLTPYIEDVARRLAVAGFMALAPDGLSPLGGYPGNDEKGAEMYRTLDQAKLQQDLFAAFDAVKTRPDCTGKVGVVGFCFGGSVANAMAARFPELAAAVPYYGGPVSAEDVPRIKAPLLIHHAGNDQRLIASLPAFEAALKANGKEYTAHIYPNTEHGFHNDTTPRYDEAAAKLSWSRTLDFFKAKLA